MKGRTSRRRLPLFVMAAAAALVTCDGSTLGTTMSGPSDSPDSGVRVLIAPGLQGVSLQVDGRSYGPLPPSGVLTVSPLDAGEHTIYLADLPSRCTVSGENPRTVLVSRGSITAVVFDMFCRPPLR